jgi:hypothetical protein
LDRSLFADPSFRKSWLLPTLEESIRRRRRAALQVLAFFEAR